MAEDIAGIKKFEINGIEFDPGEDLVFKPSYGHSKSVPTGSGKIRFQKLISPGYVKGKIFNNPRSSITSMAELTDATITITFHNGKVFKLFNARQTGDAIELEQDGSFSINFESNTSSES